MRVSAAFDEVDLPGELRGAVERHQRNIAQLVLSLRSVGMTEASIQQSTDQLLESYRPELARAIGALGSRAND
jgi:hypothetical protein